ncbi:MAG: ABC transporter substrate-binding protein, partial [Caldiserica bacterium]|nr:ABC transporter substrate-binding protein [Caldisericota bacterium]
MDRREFIKLSGKLIVGGSLAFSLPGRLFSQKAYPTLKIGYIPITDATPLLIAHALGFYEEEGIKAEKPVLVRGWSTLSEAFMSGKFNLCHLLSPIPVYMRFNLGFPVKVVAWDHVNNSALTVRKGINSLEELGGKKIAVPYWYSIHNIILQIVLRHYGITPVLEKGRGKVKPHETLLLVMPPPDMPNALASRTIDGYIVAEPFNAIGELWANAEILRFSGDIWKNHACCVAAMKENDLVEFPEWSYKVVKAIVKAEIWARNNLEKTARILSREGKGYLPFPEKVLRQAMLNYSLDTYGGKAIKHPDWNIKRIDFQPFQYPSYSEKLVENMKLTRVAGASSFLQPLKWGKVDSTLMARDPVLKAVEETKGWNNFAGVVDINS